MEDVTQILTAAGGGDAAASGRLLGLVYDELRKLAARNLRRERPGQTLQATALVHEAYLRLVGPGRGTWKDRGHFFAAAAEAMRRILVDAARRKLAVKHGGEAGREEFDSRIAAEAPDEDVLALSEALDRLAVEDPQKADLVKLRYFAGLTLEEVAAAMDISRATACRHWEYARAFLYREIRRD